MSQPEWVSHHFESSLIPAFRAKAAVSLACLSIAAVTLLGASGAQARQVPSSDLLLPYFEVDTTLGGGLTTFFSVVNSSPHPVRVEMSVHTNWGIEVVRASAALEGEEVRTINLADWLVRGRLPETTLDAQEIERCQATLTGRRSPDDGLYYSTEIDHGIAVGYVTIRTVGSPSPRVLFGDYFVVDPDRDFAQGEVLTDIDPEGAGSELCERHGLRFLLGGGFDGGTELLMWTGLAGEASANAYFPERQKTGAEILVYKQTGELVDRRQVGFEPLEVLTVADLGLDARSGWLDLVTDGPSLMAIRHSAQGRFSVGLRAVCLPKKPDGDRAHVAIETSTNGFDADRAPGLEIAFGDAVEWTYRVANDGDVALSEIRVDDSRGAGVDCPGDGLRPGESMTCTAAGFAVAGQFRNVGRVTATAPNGETVEAEDASHYFGRIGAPPVAAIEIETSTNGFDADDVPGPVIVEDDPVSWLYRVTNTGGTRLDAVTATDDQGVDVSCPKNELESGESMTCTGAGRAVRGQCGNVGSVTGRGPGGNVVDASDPSHYFGNKRPTGDDFRQGCTASFWMDNTGAWTPSGLTTGQPVESLFGAAAPYPAIASASLLEALGFDGESGGGDGGTEGAARVLARAAAAGALNAAHPAVNFADRLPELTDYVDDALASGDRDVMLGVAASIEIENNRICPLS